MEAQQPPEQSGQLGTDCVCVSSVAHQSHLTTLRLQPSMHWVSLHNAEEFLGLAGYLLTSDSADLCS